MKLESLIIRNKEVFEVWNTKLNQMFFSDFSLPHQVFKKEYRHYMFGEFDFLMYDVGWEKIRRMAQITNDSFVIMGVLDPHPQKYYYKEFGYYNWLKLPCDLKGTQYIDVLEAYPKDSLADSIMHNSSIIVWFPPSKEWIVVGDRDYGISILAIKDDSELKDNLTSFSAWRALNDDVLSWISLNFDDELLYKEFIENILKNYSNN
ncbi:hypothetical protein [Bacillus cereus]|uniref:Uncharacterized protein n=1 Tax=Bacillus cereus VD184 TaxID=1053242 RepID=A0A9W5VQ83_BACCE|nr:hypothetical protein [Bacillus cereus]EOQ04468.1 hypothetical protein IKC_05970 [Bacillus cereus VD184]